MTKIEFLKKLFATEDVKSSHCGQLYYVKGKCVWVDVFKNGQISVKMKFFTTLEEATWWAYFIYCNLWKMNGSVVDAATKWNVYHPIWGNRRTRSYAARLICDKYW